MRFIKNPIRREGKKMFSWYIESMPRDNAKIQYVPDDYRHLCRRIYSKHVQNTIMSDKNTHIKTLTNAKMRIVILSAFEQYHWLLTR